tara:strand:- start:532 stop:987 length:456 start_codon:yes stop_codon:yes gene_type:complete
MIGEIAACVSLVKGLNDAIALAKETKDNASSFANIVGSFAKANDAVLKTEAKHVGKMSVQDSLQLQVAKRQLTTFNQQLKDIMLMQGLAGDYKEIMNRVEESRLAHEKRIKALKEKQRQRDKELKQVLQILGYITLAASLGVLVVLSYRAF